MKNVFLDTNVLMDFVDNRENREYAETIIELGKTGAISCMHPICLLPIWVTFSESVRKTSAIE